MKKLAELSPLILAFLIFNGFLKLYLYYNHWNIKIIDFLDFSEILLSFLSDLNVILMFFFIYLIHFVFGERLVVFADKKVKGPLVEKPEETLNKIDNVIEPEKNAAEITHLKISEMISKWTNNNKGWCSLISLLLGASLYLFFIRYNSFVSLYFSSFLILQFLLYFFDFIGAISDDVIYAAFILIFIGFTVSISLSEVYETERNSKVTQTTIYIEGEKIITTPTNYQVGKTQNYIFLYNSQLKETQIIKLDKVDKIERKQL